LVGFQDDRLTRSEFDIFGNFDFENWVLTPNMTVVPLPQRFLPAIFDPLNPFSIPPALSLTQYPFARSQLDETPPAATVPRALGHYFLPKCASFKVEWSLDPRSAFVDGRLDGLHEVIWFDPGSADPLASLVRAEQDQRNSILVQNNLRELRTAIPFRDNALPDWDQYSFETRFGGTKYDPTTKWVGPDGRPNIVVFRANVPRQNAAGKITFVPEDIFPHALRITVELYDSNGRLDKPTRHVMVVPIGS